MSETCSICQDVFREPKFLKCGHTFCQMCIKGCLNTCQRRDKIVCPLCREITMCPSNSICTLFDNYFAKTRRSEPKIDGCNECKDVGRVSACDHCDVILCEPCMNFHTQKVVGDHTNFTIDSFHHDLEEDGGGTDRVGSWYLHSVQTKYVFEVQRRILIPMEFTAERSGRVGLDSGAFFIKSSGICVVVPRGSSSILEYSPKGEVVSRRHLPIQVSGIAKGIGYKILMVRDCSTQILEYDNGNIREIIDTESIVTFVASTIGNGSIVVLGAYLERHGHHLRPSSCGVMRIYDYNGRLIREVSEQAGNSDLNHPRCVSVNLTNKHIYVGDVNKRKILHFDEDCELISSYVRDEDSIVPDGLSVFLEDNINFPLSLCHSQTRELLFASCYAIDDISIRVLSSSLQLLGFFQSSEMFRIPIGLFIDKDDSLYVGDGAVGIIHVYKLSKFMNNLGDN